MLKIEIPMYIPSIANMQTHWSIKYRIKKDQKETVKLFLSLMKGKLEGWDNYHVELVRISPRALDEDNLYSAMKSIIDACAEVINPGLAPGRADGQSNFKFTCSQEKGKPPRLKILISQA
jgi:hypothetical protein